MERKICILLAMLFLLPFLHSVAGAEVTFNRIGQFPGGETYVMALKDNTLFINTGPLLEIYDVTDRENPVKISELSFGENNIGGLDVKDNYLYVLHEGGISIVDISNVSNPIVIGWNYFEEPRSFKAGFQATVKGYYLYVVVPDRFIIYDVSNPYNPIELGHFDKPVSTNARFRRFDISGNYAFIAECYGGPAHLYIVDISDPRNPTEVTRIPKGGRNGWADVAIDEDRNIMFALEYREVLHAYDITNISNPVELGTLGSFIYEENPIQPVNSILLDGNFIYGSAYYYGAYIIDVSDPSNMSIYSKACVNCEFSKAGYVEDIIKDDKNYIYISHQCSGFSITDVSDLKNPDPVAWVPTHGRFDSLIVKEGYLLTVAENEFLVINVLDPEEPKFVYRPFIWRRGEIQPVSDDYAFLPSWSYWRLIDISDPTNIKVVKDYDYDHTEGVLRNNTMYAIQGGQFWNRFLIFDATDLANLTLIGEYCLIPGVSPPCHVDEPDVEYLPYSINVKGDYAYIGVGTKHGIWIFDVSDPTNIKKVGEILNGSYIPAITIYGDYMYAFDGDELIVFDISDPANPVETDRVDIPYHAPFPHPIPKWKNYLVMYGDELGLINISDPAHPFLEKTYKITREGAPRSSGNGPFVWFEGDYLYAMDGWRALYVFKYGPKDTTPPEIKNLNVKADMFSATITWQTDKAADSLIKYGTEPGNYTKNAYIPTKTKNHSITLEGLEPNTTYYFVVQSTDWNGNKNETTELSFTTKADIYPPVITIINPSEGERIIGGTTEITVKIETDEIAYCQYGESDFDYGEGIDFPQQGTTLHFFNLSVSDGKSYTFYYKCKDKYGNIGSAVHHFSVASEWWDYFDDETKIEEKNSVLVENGEVKIKFPENKFYPTKDARISPVSGRNTGTADLAVGDSDKFRTLIEFSLPNIGGEIGTVKLYLYAYETHNPSYNHTIYVHLLEGGFDEYHVNWTYRNETEKWQNEGGDFNPAIIDHYDASGEFKGEWISFTLKGENADNPIDINWGDTFALLLKGPSEYNVRSDYFESREMDNEPYIEVLPSSVEGSIVSIPITPTSLHSWDKFYADYETPEGTYISFSILDAETGEVLCSNLNGKGDDISACLSGVQSIKLKAELRTDNPPATPILKEWRVSWITGRNDTTPPITTTEITPQPNEKGWINSTPVVVTFHRSDDSDVAYTNYSFSQEGSWSTVPGSDSFNITITDEGIFTIWYYSVDIFGNKESVKNITLKIDITPPSIKNITVTHANSTVITWITTEKADSLVKYGTSSGNYTLRKYNSSYVKYHRIVLSDLLPNTTYYFVVNSTDKAGNSNQSSEGSFLTPPTPPRPPSETVTIEGKEKVDDAMLLEAATDYGYYPYIYIGKYGWRTCRGVLKFNLSSIPRNASILSAKLELNAYDVSYNVSLNVHKLLASWEEYEVTWYNRNRTVKWENPGGDFGPAIETKSFNSSGKVVFECRKIAEVVQEWVKNPESNYGFLLEADDSAPEGKFFIIYQTDRNEKLAPKLVVTYELTGDVSPPEIRNVSVACTNNSATIEWDTDEISDSLVRYGTESGNYSYEAYDSAFVMHHNITIRGLEGGRTYYFEVVSADTSGNKARRGEYKFKTHSSMPVTVVIGGENIEDAWLAKHLYFRNYGWYPWIYIGNTSYGISRGIIKFNLSSIPENSKIIQAKLIVKIDGPSPYGAPSNSSLSVHKVLNSWDEYEVTWDKRNKSENWNTSGGDFSPKIAEISNFSGYPTLIMNENITDVVKEWCEYPEKNYGFILEWDNAPEGKYFVIAQKEYYTEDAPKLEVTYILPS